MTLNGANWSEDIHRLLLTRFPQLQSNRLIQLFSLIMMLHFQSLHPALIWSTCGNHQKQAAAPGQISPNLRLMGTTLLQLQYRIQSHQNTTGVS